MRLNTDIMDDVVTLDYGSGGKKTSELIDNIIVPAFNNEELASLGDGAVLDGNLVFSTDSFVINPYFFPGGDIGKLAVCGTVNDISVSGGLPRYLSLAAIIEEGFPMEHLKLIIESAAREAEKCGVQIVTGDTKVVEKGGCDGIYLNTAGIGTLRHPGLSSKRISAGDKVIVSGNIGDHGLAVMLARNENLITGKINSDCAPLNEITGALSSLGEDLKVMRDPTRGGLATTLCEFVEGSRLSIELSEGDIPVSEAVKNASDILGLDPLYSANEGKLIAVVSAEKAKTALEIMKTFAIGENAAVIGEVSGNNPGRVIIKTAFGGSRIVTRLSGAQLPRIC